MKDALRAKDKVAKRTLTMVRAAIQQAEKDRRQELDETTVLAILQKKLSLATRQLPRPKKGRDVGGLGLADTRNRLEIRPFGQIIFPGGIGVARVLAFLGEKGLGRKGPEFLAGNWGKGLEKVSQRVGGRPPGGKIPRELFRKTLRR